GFWETAAKYWRPKAAMYTADWNLKPEGVVWNDLVHKQWTTDAAGKTDGNGDMKIRGFYGEYNITVNGQERSATLNENGETTQIMLGEDEGTKPHRD
ncbi:MAG TPA: hypothetical protein VG722_11790, partial [Tepidisphaeraceae bacterium]|nr:hypothetical protein [Tepidisphaeraceae bacterium]